LGFDFSNSLLFGRRQDAMKKNVQNVIRLGFEGCAPAREMIREHGPIQQVAEHSDDPLNRDIASPTFRDQCSKEFSPRAHIGVAMLEIGGLISVLKFRSFQDQQLDELGMIGKKSKIGMDGKGQSLQWFGDAFNFLVHACFKAKHGSVHGGKKKNFFARKISVDRPFANFKPVCQHLNVGVMVAKLGKEFRGLVEDLFLAMGLKRFIERASAPPLIRACRHGFLQVDGLVRHSYLIAKGTRSYKSNLVFL